MQFNVRVYCESYQPGDEESFSELVHQDDSADLRDIQSMVREYGTFARSSTGPVGCFDWLRSEHPDEDRDYIEWGIEKFYSLHITDARGEKLSSRRLARIYRAIGVR